ncbi:hypothetical protein RHSIM_Rhsim03G0169000 [Rhododendron simsii]|uniref:Amino acid permease/ SLC12A domain-containing protein n=1 Tax=Rhododendron simsii TaxID=118357 RepID=A0A834HD35_RHOSS|nr:hypothetical protein RHSIM_Rhsim03G0169000 [Rhododendron simsii]
MLLKIFNFECIRPFAEVLAHLPEVLAPLAEVLVMPCSLDEDEYDQTKACCTILEPKDGILDSGTRMMGRGGRKRRRRGLGGNNCYLCHIVGSFEVDVSNWSPFAPNGFRAVLMGVTVAFFAFDGFDAVANSAEESKRPQLDENDRPRQSEENEKRSRRPTAAQVERMVEGVR